MPKERTPLSGGTQVIDSFPGFLSSGKRALPYLRKLPISYSLYGLVGLPFLLVLFNIGQAEKRDSCGYSLVRRKGCEYLAISI